MLHTQAPAYHPPPPLHLRTAATVSLKPARPAIDTLLVDSTVVHQYVLPVQLLDYTRSLEDDLARWMAIYLAHR